MKETAISANFLLYTPGDQLRIPVSYINEDDCVDLKKGKYLVLCYICVCISLLYIYTHIYYIYFINTTYIKYIHHIRVHILIHIIHYHLQTNIYQLFTYITYVTFTYTTYINYSPYYILYAILCRWSFSDNQSIS